MAGTATAIDHDAIAVLRFLALEGGLESDVKVSCAGLADDLDVSNQTASRRLQHLEDAETIERELVPDGQWIAVTEEGQRILRSEFEAYRRLFEEDRAVRLRGTVTAGMGEGRHYISLEGYHVQFVERLGYEPFPGTLNVTLDEESVRRRGRIEPLDPIPIDGWEDDNRTYGPAACYPATVRNREDAVYEQAHVIIPERTHHDADNLEVIAPEKLRDVLDLEDDDWIDIAVSSGDGT